MTPIPPNIGAHLEARIRTVTAATINKLAQDLSGRAARDAPVMEGTLRGTAHVEEAKPSDLKAVVSFSTPYAARQHEELTWNHPKGGKAKYLEDPLKEIGPQYLAALGAAVRQAIRLG